MDKCWNLYILWGVQLPCKGTISIKKEILIFRIQKCKIERETNSETCFHLFCQMHSEEFPFHLWKWEIELVKCSLHIPLLNLSQSLITYWQSIGATIEDFVPKFRKSFSHQEFQPHPVHPNYENNTWSNKNTWLLPIQSNKNIFDSIQYLSISLQTSAAVSMNWPFSLFHYFHQLFIVCGNI